MRDFEFLVGQLGEALADVKSGQGDAFEVACLAGLVWRFCEAPAELLAAERWGASPEGSAALNEAICALVPYDTTRGVLESEEGDEPEERLDALLAMDEMCAGLHWAFATFMVTLDVDLVERAISAFPEPWIALAPLARVLLASPSAPAETDPARKIWAAVASARPFAP